MANVTTDNTNTVLATFNSSSTNLTINNVSLFATDSLLGTRRFNATQVNLIGPNKWEAMFSLTPTSFGHTMLYVTIESGNDLDSANTTLIKVTSGSVLKIYGGNIITDDASVDRGPAPNTINSPDFYIRHILKAGLSTSITTANVFLTFKTKGVETIVLPELIVLPTALTDGYIDFFYSGFSSFEEAIGSYSYRIVKASNNDTDVNGVTLTKLASGYFRIVESSSSIRI